MVIKLYEHSIGTATIMMDQWLEKYSNAPRGLGRLTARKILAEFGPGIYEIKEKGKLYKGSELVVHRDDIEVFIMGKEVKVKTDKKEDKSDKVVEFKKEDLEEEKAPKTSGAGPDRRRARKKSNPWAK